MKYLISIIMLTFTGCTQYGPTFSNCTDENSANLALDIALENMENIPDTVSRTDFICKKERPMPAVECYIARTGDKDFGNRGMIVIRDQYAGECIIHELYHVELGVAYGSSCNSHSKACNWDYDWLETLLDEFKQSK